MILTKEIGGLNPALTKRQMLGNQQEIRENCGCSGTFYFHILPPV
jgi:hypothetical protein